MFHFWTRRVLREGARTEGQVYALTAYGDPAGSVADYGVKVRVKLPDGSTREFEKGPLGVRHVGQLFVGSVVPVRYDPKDPKKVALDLPALEAARAEVDAARQAQLDTQFDRMCGDSGGPSGATAPGDIRTQLLQLAAGGGGVVDLRGSGTQASGPVERIAKLSALKDQGLIDEAQFAAVKKRIVDEGGGR
jgi:hypothetical protein